MFKNLPQNWRKKEEGEREKKDKVKFLKAQASKKKAEKNIKGD